MNKNDLRSIKTEEKIKNAFILLLNKHGFHKTTVSQIITEANINRSTFYAHYLDKYDLLKQMENTLLNEMYSIITITPTDNLIINNTITLPEEHINAIIQYIYEHRDIFYLLLSENGDKTFINKFKDMIKSVWEYHNIINKLTIPPNYAISGTAGIFSSLIEEWAKNDFAESPKIFTRIIKNIMLGFSSSIIKSSG